MQQLTLKAAKRLEQVPRALAAEFPTVPLEALEHELAERVHQLVGSAHFDDFIPLLAHRAVRARLRDAPAGRPAHGGVSSGPGRGEPRRQQVEEARVRGGLADAERELAGAGSRS